MSHYYLSTSTEVNIETIRQSEPTGGGRTFTDTIRAGRGILWVNVYEQNGDCSASSSVKLGTEQLTAKFSNWDGQSYSTYFDLAEDTTLTTYCKLTGKSSASGDYMAVLIYVAYF